MLTAQYVDSFKQIIPCNCLSTKWTWCWLKCCPFHPSLCFLMKITKNAPLEPCFSSDPLQMPDLDQPLLDYWSMVRDHLTLPQIVPRFLLEALALYPFAVFKLSHKSKLSHKVKQCNRERPFLKRTVSTNLECEIGENALKHRFSHPGWAVLHLKSVCSSLYTLSTMKKYALRVNCINPFDMSNNDIVHAG